MWNIKKTVKKGDYLYAVVPEHPKASRYGYVLYHRVVMENVIGRILLDSEEVHHINGNKHDNSPENLDVVTKREHRRMHMKDRYPNGPAMMVMFCKQCGNRFERRANQRPEVKSQKDAFCSRRCNGIYNGYKKRSDNTPVLLSERPSKS